MSSEIRVRTAPVDNRFPTTNQTRHCWARYLEYHACVKHNSAEDTECDKYRRWYLSLCPAEWVEKWDEQKENGTFAGPE